MTFTGNGINATLTLVNGAVTLSTGASLPALTAGAYNVTATYNGDATYLTAANSAAFTVAKGDTTTTAVSVNGVATVTVLPIAPGAGTPTGLVSIYSGAVLAGSPIATGPLTNGAFSTAISATQYFAVYAGDQNFNGSSSAASAATAPKQTVTSAVTLTSSSSLVSANQSVTLTASVIGSGGPGAPTGAVTFTDNGIALGTTGLSGSLANITSTFANGNHIIVATYGGDSVYPSASATYALTVGKPSAAITFASNLTTAVFGQPVILTARIAAQGSTAVPTGTVQFFDGSISLGTASVSNGIAALSVTTLPVGVNNLTAAYSGDATYASAVASGVSVTVNKAQTAAILTASTNTGQETLSAAVAPVPPGGGTPTGTVQFIDTVTSNVEGSAVLAGGVASIVIPVTTDPIVAVYSGDSNFSAATSAQRLCHSDRKRGLLPHELLSRRDCHRVRGRHDHSNGKRGGSTAAIHPRRSFSDCHR